MNELIPLPRLPAALLELTNIEPPGYRALWHAAVACKFPSSVIAGRYQVKRADLPEIAEKLGMTMPASIKAHRKPLLSKISA